MADTPMLVPELTQARQMRLARQLHRGKVPGSGSVVGPARSTIPRRPAGMDRLPLSFAQEQLWFACQLAPDTPTYNVPLAIRLEGGCDHGALEQALRAMLAHHESLRTTFISIDGTPWQVIGPPPPLRLELSDLTALPDDGERAAELSRISTTHAQQPFALDSPPLLRTHLVRLAEDSHVLLMTVHHLVFDGWSAGVFLRELGARYDQFAATTGTATVETLRPEPALQYADYALWQRAELTGDRLSRLLGYWTSQLDNPPVLELPTDRPRPPVQSFAGAHESLEITGSVMSRLRALSRDHGATLFMTLLASFAVLLSRYSNQDDIVVGTPAANRNRTELESVIGYFVNMLPIRIDLSGDPTFVELLDRVQQTTMNAYVHQELPLPTLVDALHLKRDPSRSPLFSAGFTVQDHQASTFSSALRIAQMSDVSTATAKTDLSLFIAESADRLGLGMEYAVALFDREAVRRMLSHLRVLLEGIAADPGRRLSTLPLLTARDRRRQLVEWNDTVAPAPIHAVHELFEARAAATPEATAAVLADQRVSYRQLDRQANQVAWYLRRLGVGPDVLVGICAGRSLRRLAAILGVLKAGGAYLPLDPDYPAERLAFMLRDSAAAVLLADSATVDTFVDPDHQVTVVGLDTDWAAITSCDDAALPSHAGGHNLAYVIYTSGSTGQPKGVLIEHRSVANYIVAASERFAVGPHDRVLQFAPVSFDASVFEMFAALTRGATLCLTDQDTVRSPGRIARLLRAERITLALLTPGVAAVLASEATTFPDLRTLVIGGEAFSSELVRALSAPGRRVCNGYGPTETTVAVVVGECRGDEPVPPIGRPLANQQVYVLDRHLNPVPVGVTGQLYVGGSGLARGYLHRPALTAERFIPNPFARETDREGWGADRRLYATGDLARWLPDGTLVLLGRADNQVKIRGYRVELGEIETVLAAHPRVAQAAVLLREDVPGCQQLVGYVIAEAGEVGEPGEVLDLVAELRAQLQARLPSYMVPTQLVALDAFPLTASGKVDRGALPAPQALPEGTQPARTVVEALLAEVFTEVLGVAAVGVDDNFFDLGGNSLQAMRLLARLRDLLAVDVDVTVVFRAPTITTMAELLCTEHGLEDAELTDEDLAS